jgi:hypothetical protein
MHSLFSIGLYYIMSLVIAPAPRSGQLKSQGNWYQVYGLVDGADKNICFLITPHAIMWSITEPRTQHFYFISESLRWSNTNTSPLLSSSVHESHLYIFPKLWQNMNNSVFWDVALCRSCMNQLVPRSRISYTLKRVNVSLHKICTATHPRTRYSS